MPHQPDHETLGQIARDSRDTASAGMARRKDFALATDIVDGLVTAATQAAKQALVSPPTGAETVWQDVLEMLAEEGLSPDVRCNRTGRLLYTVSPLGWSDHLAAIARFGDTASGDAARLRLLDSILWQLASTTAPYALWSDPVALAALRESSAIDFLCISLEHIQPMPRQSTNADKARRARDLGQAREAMESLPGAALQYAAECVTLYLSYVRPGDLPDKSRLVSIPSGPAFADVWRSPATVGHFCGRLIQTLTGLLAGLALRPAGTIGAGDLRRLRSQYKGNTSFPEIRKYRAIVRADKRKADILGRDIVTPSMRARLAELDATTHKALDSFASDLLDTFDLAAHLTFTGRPTTIQEATAIERQYLTTKAERAKAAQEYEARRMIAAPGTDDDNGDDETISDDADLFDLSSLLLSGGIPDDMLATYDSADDLVAAGLLSVDDMLDGLAGDSGLPDFDDTYPDADADEWEPDHALLSQLMADARPSRPRSIQPRKPVTASKRANDISADALAEALQAMESGTVAPLPSPAPVVQRRSVTAPPPATPAPVSPSPAAPASNVVPIRRRPVAP